MINLQVHLGTPPNAAAVLIASLVSVAWVWFCFRRDRLSWAPLPFLLVALACALFWAACSAAPMDETANLHRAWLVAHGQLPFRDFWDEHPPLLLLALAPVMQLLDGSAWILEISRTCFALLFLLTATVGWLMARRVWKDQASPIMYLLVLLSGCTIWRFAYAKPDPIMILLLLLALFFTFDLAAGRRWAGLLVGFLIGLGLSFTFKQYPLALLPPLVILVTFRLRGFGRLALYALGLVLGAAPLAGYLLYHGLGRDFILWNCKFNSGCLVASADFSLALAVVAAAGGYGLFRRWQTGRDHAAFVFLAAFLLCCGASLFTLAHTITYYLGFWLVLAAVLAAGLGLDRWTDQIRRRRLSAALVVGLICCLLVFPMVGEAYFQFNFQRAHPPQSRLGRALLARICRDETCLTLQPNHPLCARDATRLYTWWQFVYLAKDDAAVDDYRHNVLAVPILESSQALIRDDLGRDGFAAPLLARPPALIAHDIDGRDTFDALHAAGLISADDLAALHRLLEQQYVLETIGQVQFYVRRDRDFLCH